MKKTFYLPGLLALIAFLFVTAPVSAQDPYMEANDAWISVTGTVGSVGRDEFTLNYESSALGSDRAIIVEMDDGDRDADAYKLLPGDTVTVVGKIDDGLFEARTIEASSVYVANLDTFFYADSRDEEDNFVTVMPPVVSSTVVQGVVTEVHDQGFKLEVGGTDLSIDVEQMAYNPLDDEGYQQIDVGDLVTVTGEMDYNLLEGRELVATSVTTLENG